MEPEPYPNWLQRWACIDADGNPGTPWGIEVLQAHHRAGWPLEHGRDICIVLWLTISSETAPLTELLRLGIAPGPGVLRILGAALTGRDDVIRLRIVRPGKPGRRRSLGDHDGLKDIGLDTGQVCPSRDFEIIRRLRAGDTGLLAAWLDAGIAPWPGMLPLFAAMLDPDDRRADELGFRIVAEPAQPSRGRRRQQWRQVRNDLLAQWVERLIAEEEVPSVKKAIELVSGEVEATGYTPETRVIERAHTSLARRRGRAQRK